MDRRHFLALAGGSTFVAGCFGSSPSRTPRNDTETPATTNSPSDSGGVSIRWQAELGKRIPVPAVMDSAVFAVSSKTGVYALTADDGIQQWHHSTPSSGWFGPAVGGKIVYAVDWETLIAFEAMTGEERWRHRWPEESAMEAMPVVGETAVFIGISSQPTSHTDSQFPEDLWAFDRRDGSLLWKRDLSEGGPSGISGPLSGPPIFHDGWLYVQTQNGGILKLDPADGTEQWRVRLDGPSEGGGPTLVSAHRTLVVQQDVRSPDDGQGGALVGLSTEDGHRRWRRGGIQTAPVSDGTRVFGGEIADFGGRSTVYGLSAEDGSEEWTFTKPGRLKTWSSLSAADGRLFASFTERTGRGAIADDDSTLYAVGRDGMERWQFQRTCNGFSPAIVSDGTVYVAGRLGNGWLYALEPGP